MAVSFEVLFGNSESSRLGVDQFPATVGRHPDATIRIPDQWVSRLHCELVIENGILVVRDLGSINGMLVNNQPAGESELLPGDEFQVGLTIFRVQYDPAQLDGTCLLPSDCERPTLVAR